MQLYFSHLSIPDLSRGECDIEKSRKTLGAKDRKNIKVEKFHDVFWHMLEATGLVQIMEDCTDD